VTRVNRIPENRSPPEYMIVRTTHLLIALSITATLFGCGNTTSPEGSPEVASAPAHPGEEIFLRNCAVCHISGMSGAPVISKPEQWAELLPKGVDALTLSAINGLGAMPAKGGATQLSDAQVRQAVEFMTSKVKQ